MNYNFNFLLPVTLFFLLLSCSERKEYEAKWFAFNPERDFQNSLIMMEDWLDAPAGKHGFVQIDGENFKFEDGAPIKFWGVNICSGKPYV